MGLIKLKIPFLKTQTLHCWCNNLIYSLLLQKKKRALKIIIFNKERENVTWISRLTLRITIWYSIKKVWRWFTFESLYKKLIFLYQRLDLKDSKPSSSKILSVEDPLMAVVMASVALYWSDSSLAWKESLNVLSYIISP